MDRERSFDEFLEECKKNQQICGAGNPYAQILLVGQEHRAESKISNYNDWQNYLEENYRYCEIDNPWIITDDKSDSWRKFQNSTPTWRCYQRLIEKALPNRHKRMLHGDNDFEFDAFTTELNNEAKPSSKVKGKDERENLRERIDARLKVFKDSDFIKRFPVIILACGGYIRNDDKVREIDNIFHVTFSKRYDYSKGNWFCTHYDDTNPKRLVIHTRQLSNGVSYKMIDCMAKVIRGHLQEHGLI